LLANADGALLRRIGGFAVAASGLPFALFNQVIVEGDEGSQEALTAGVGIMRDRGSPFIVNLRVGADDAVAAMALELGLVRMSERPWMPGMAMHPVPIEPSHGDIAGYEIRRAIDRAGLEDHIHTAAAGFDMTEELIRAVVAPNLLDLDDVAIYVGYADGDPVFDRAWLSNGPDDRRLQRRHARERERPRLRCGHDPTCGRRRSRGGLRRGDSAGQPDGLADLRAAWLQDGCRVHGLRRTVAIVRMAPPRTIEIGLVLPMGESFVDGSTARWAEIRDLARRAEEIGFDTVWTADELLWRPPEGATHGWWECVAMTGAVAAATSRVKVGTWVLSALHRNPGITAKAIETIDEISDGRFVLGLGSGHAGRQAHAFGLPEDHVFGRFEEAVQIIVPLLREGRADFGGNLPRGPRPGASAGRTPARPHPDHDRRQGPEDAPAGRSACRHLELVRRGTERPHGVRAAP